MDNTLGKQKIIRKKQEICKLIANELLTLVLNDLFSKANYGGGFKICFHNITG